MHHRTRRPHLAQPRAELGLLVDELEATPARRRSPRRRCPAGLDRGRLVSVEDRLAVVGVPELARTGRRPARLDLADALRVERIELDA